MARSHKPVRHLQNRNGRYFARLAVPKDLQSIVGKHELLAALGADRGVAITKLHEAVASFHKTLSEARDGIKPPPLPVSVREAVHRHYARELELDRAIDLAGERPREYAKMYSEEWSEQYRHNLERVAAGSLNLKEVHEGMIEATIGWAFNDLPPGTEKPKHRSKEWFELAKALAKAQVEVIDRARERNRGNWRGEPSFELLREAPAGPPAPVSIKGLFESYLEMRGRSGIGAEARKRWRPCFRDLVSFLGHDDARQITTADLRRWVEHLRETRGEKTIKDVYLGSVKAVLGHAAEHDLIDGNPAQQVKVRLARRTLSREQGYTDEEAEALLKVSRAYLPKHSDNPQTREGDWLVAAKRWAPALCAHTGARISEMTQLRKEDVREKDGIHYLRLTPDAGSIKTRKYRDVPLHAQLIGAGFLDFVARAADGPLFYRVNPDRKGTTHPSKAVSGRISEWIRSINAAPLDVQPNHAWRHRMKTIGLEIGVGGRVLDAIHGHAPRTAGDTYGDVTLKAKAAVIAKFPNQPGL